jgi:hypothetical protein
MPPPFGDAPPMLPLTAGFFSEWQGLGWAWDRVAREFRTYGWHWRGHGSCFS